MTARHWLWWRRADPYRTEVLVIFDAAEFDVVSITDASGSEQVLSDTETDALRQHIEACCFEEALRRAA